MYRSTLFWHFFDRGCYLISIAQDHLEMPSHCIERAINAIYGALIFSGTLGLVPSNPKHPYKV